MTTFAIPLFIVPVGTHVLGPFTIPGGWSHLELSLDIASLTSMDALTEFSGDGGATWQMLVHETGLAAAINPLTGLLSQYRLRANWSPPLPPGQVRTTFTNVAAFTSAGGQLVVT